MHINAEQADRNSETEFASQLSTFIDAGAGVIHVRANETLRACIAIRRQALADRCTVKEWNVVSGFSTFTGRSNIDTVIGAGDGDIDVVGAMSAPLVALRNPVQAVADQGKTYFVYVNPHPFMEDNPTISHLIMTYAHALPSSQYVVLLVTPDIPIPGYSDANLLSVTFNPPGLGELRGYLSGILGDVADDFPEGTELDDEELDRVCYVGAGMPKNHFEMYAAVSIVRAGRAGQDAIDADALVTGISQGKTDIVNSNDLLELYESTDISNVGGLENLKAWVAKRRACYSDEAKQFGIEPPKGMVLVGPPGTGKSLVAKAVSSELGVPLVRLDFGRVFNSLVGASEQRIRTALKMVENISPCVLFCDEIDKGLGGIGGGGGDSGTSSRVLGSFLTWLQDCKHPVFTMVTANNVTGLPPELLRRGRFDAIFSTNMPTPKEREEVLRIHLKQRGQNIKDFDRHEVVAVINASEGYVPAEIESAVKDALVDAFDEGEDLTMEHVQKALARMIPLSRAFAREIETMREWATNNATPAGLVEPAATDTPVSTRRVSTRSRTGRAS